MDVSRLRRIVELDKRVEKYLEYINKFRYTLEYLEHYITCDPYEDEFCPGKYSDYLGRLEYWVKLYERISGKEPDRVLNEISYDTLIRVDYSDMTLIEICREKSPFDCVALNIKLPLDREKKEKMLKAVKEKIADILDNTVEAFADTLLALKEIVYGLKHALDDLERKYNEIKREIEQIVGIEARRDR